MTNISQQLALEINASSQQVLAATKLLDEGATVPFIARYRKEVTGGLDDTQLRLLEQRLGYLRELNERREFILTTIKDQGKLTDSLSLDIANAASKTELEDLYLPYKPKRRTKGQIAIEVGLEPLANALLVNTHLVPEVEAAKYVNTEAKITDEWSLTAGFNYYEVDVDYEQTLSILDQEVNIADYNINYSFTGPMISVQYTF